MDVPQVTTFTSIVESSKVMSLISDTCFELKSFDYGAIIIEFVNCLPTNSMVTYSLNFLLVCHPLGHFRQLQVDKKYNGHAWCKLQTNNIKNSFRLGFRTQNALDICVVKMIFILCFNIFLHAMNLIKVVIVCSFQYLGSIL